MGARMDSPEHLPAAVQPSAIGKKSVELIPILNQEGMSAIQEVSFSLTPAFHLAVDARLREAGIEVGAP